MKLLTQNTRWRLEKIEKRSQKECLSFISYSAMTVTIDYLTLGRPNPFPVQFSSVKTAQQSPDTSFLLSGRFYWSWSASSGNDRNYRPTITPSSLRSTKYFTSLLFVNNSAIKFAYDYVVSINGGDDVIKKLITFVLFNVLSQEIHARSNENSEDFWELV